MKRSVFIAALALLTLVVTFDACKPKKKVHRSGGKNSGGRMY